MTSEENTKFFEKSPASVALNVRTPTLLLIGGADKRVPPHPAYHYYNTLKAQGVKTKLYKYPGDGHIILSNEPSMDSTMNISFWFDEIFNS